MRGPSVGRFLARLALLEPEVLLDLVAQACYDIPALRHYVDAVLAQTPTSDKALDKVLLSPDLAPCIFASLEVEDHAAGLVCTAWGVEWKAHTRRILRPAPLPAPDFELKKPVALAALPGGERLAIATQGLDPRVYIVDKEMRLQRTLGDAASGVTIGDVNGLAAGDDGLYVSAASLTLLKLDTFAVAATHMSDGHVAFCDLALAPGVLFASALSYPHDGVFDNPIFELFALDALSLEARFTVGKDVLGRGWIDGLAVCGDELWVSKSNDCSIHVLSLSGEPRRVMSSQPGGWRTAAKLCCVADRLYLTEELEDIAGDDEGDGEVVTGLAGRRIFVLTPEGRTLHVYNSPRPLEEEFLFSAMCHFDGKLMLVMADPRDSLAESIPDAEYRLIAMQGL